MKSRLPQEYMERYRSNKIRKVPQMTLYDLNRQLVRQVPPMNDDEKKTFVEQIFNNYQKDGNYFMLLCKELSYFTVFHKDENNEENFADTVFNTLNNCGSLITAGWDNEQEKAGIEYWMSVKTPIENNPDYEEIYCFYLFKYDKGIVEVK